MSDEGRKRGPYKKYLTSADDSLPKRSKNFYINEDDVGTSRNIEVGDNDRGNYELNANAEGNHGYEQVFESEQDNNLIERNLTGLSSIHDTAEGDNSDDDVCAGGPDNNIEQVSDTDQGGNGDVDVTNCHHSGAVSYTSQKHSTQSSTRFSRRCESEDVRNENRPAAFVPPARMMNNDPHLDLLNNIEVDRDQQERTAEAQEELHGEARETEEQPNIDIFCDHNDFELVGGDDQQQPADEGHDDGQSEEEEGGGERQQEDNEQQQQGDEEQVQDREEQQQDGEHPERPFPAHRNLWKEIHSHPDFISSVLTEVNSSPAEILLKILALSQQNNFSFKSFVDTVHLVNSLFVNPVIPGTQHLLDKLLLSETELLRYFYCKDCSYFFGNIDHTTTPEIVCPKQSCGTINKLKDLTKASHFVIFDVASQLELLFMNKDVRENLVHPKDAVRQNNNRNLLKDVYDGKCYREFASSLPDNLIEKVLSFVVCTDGSPLFKSSNYSIWPFFLCVNELPPLIRMNNLILGGLWFGSRHPPMDLYLQPLVDHLKSLSLRGIKVNVEAEEWLIRAYVIACCVDSGARGAVQGINSHSGYYSCNWCLIPGFYLENKVVFPFSEEDYQNRTHDNVKLHGQECLANDGLSYVFGVQYVSPLVGLPKFDIALGMVQDFPHNVPFGIGRTFLDEWLHNSKRSFYIGSPEELCKLNKRMEQLQPCIEVRRAVRLLKDMAFWKAREFENWVVIYSLIVLLSILSAKYWTHWSYLVQAVYLLIRDSVTTDNVNMAHRLIKYWVADVEALYGQKYMTFNVHIFSHFAENVSRWGPAWAVSTYCFESAIGKLKNILHAHRGVPHQIHRQLSYNQARNILSNTCSTPRTDIFMENIKSKPNKMTRYLSLAECAVIGKEDDFVPNLEEQYLIRNSEHDIDEDNCVMYDKIIASRCVFTTESVAAGKKFNNSVALTTAGLIVILKKFIRDKNTDKVFAFCTEIATRDFLKFPPGIRILSIDHCVRIVASIGRRLKLLSVKDLKISCVLTKMEENTYVTPFHNLYNVC